MMRNCIVFALFVASACAAAVTPNNKVPYFQPRTADLEYLQKQKYVFELLAYVDPIVHTDAEYYQIGYNYDVFANIDRWVNKEYVYQFFNYYNAGILSQDAAFTYYNQQHREEMIALYNLFYFAKDFETFYNVACWARVHVNHGMFVTAFTSAVVYRNDTKYIRLPAIYEIYPNLFFDSRVIREAQRLKMTRGYGYQQYRHDEQYPRANGNNAAVETYYLYSNYSEMCVSPAYEYEYRLNYFVEDVDLNAWYYYFRMAYPFWMDTQDYQVPSSQFRGDLYYFFHTQLMSRYYLERFSHGMTSLSDFTWDRMSLPGFYGDYVYSNGVAMPKRDWWNVVPFYKYRYVEMIKQFEQRIFEAIDAGYFFDEAGKKYDFYTPEGLNYLANLIEGNCDSHNVRYFGAYDVLARDILGQNFDCKCKDYYVPSALEYFETSLKDPAFYRIYDRIMSFFHRYKANLQRYTEEELAYPGVRFESVQVDKLVTFYDRRDYYINNAVSFESWKEGNYFNIRTWRYHLDYKPFAYHFTVSAEQPGKAVVRIFLGPAIEGQYYDNYSYILNYYKYFYELDEFEVELQSGVNTFERQSSDSYFFKKNYYSADYYYQQVLSSIQGSEPFPYTERQFGFPDHLMLPRGTVEGMRFKLFFFIAPYTNAKVFEVPFLGNFKYYGQSFGYPLDRPMQPWFVQLSNAYFQDVFIYHERFQGAYNYSYYNYNQTYYHGGNNYYQGNYNYQGNYGSQYNGNYQQQQQSSYNSYPQNQNYYYGKNYYNYQQQQQPQQGRTYNGPVNANAPAYQPTTPYNRQFPFYYPATGYYYGKQQQQQYYNNNSNYNNYGYNYPTGKAYNNNQYYYQQYQSKAAYPGFFAPEYYGEYQQQQQQQTPFYQH